MTMPEKTIHDLPYEILVKVFSYLTLKDIVLGVRRVSDYWNEVSQDWIIWKYLPYRPSYTTSESDILNIIKMTPKLQIFKPQGCVRRKILETIITYCRDIREIDVYVDSAGDRLIHKLVKECSNIENLTLYALDFESSKCLKIISKCSKLKSLKLSGNASTSRCFFTDIADGCPSLEALDLKNLYDYSNKDLQYLLSKNNNIMSLDLRWTSERGKCTLPVVSCCAKLEALYVEEYVDVQTSDGFLSLKSMHNLRILSMPYFRHCNVNYMIDFFSNGHVDKIVKLDLTVYENFEDKLAWIIFEKCFQLKYLRLVFCPKLTDEGLIPIHQLKYLQYLSVAGCDQITDRGVSFIARCSKLHYLNLNTCSKLTTKSFSFCSSNLKLLRELHMNSCSICVDPQSVLEVPQNLKYLKVLSICSYHFGDNVIKSLGEKMSSLRFISPQCNNTHSL